MDGRKQFVPSAQHRLDRTPSFIGALLFLGGLTVLMVGWWMDVYAVRVVLPGTQSMMPDTALGFALLGVALISVARARLGRVWTWSASVATALITILAAVTIGEYWLGWSSGVEALLSPSSVDTTAGQMAPGTAIAFFLSAVALASFTIPRRWSQRLAHWCAVGVGAIGAAAIVGYVYDVSALYKVAIYTSMAFNTAAGFILAALGLATLRWAQSPVAMLAHSTADGTLARRLLPAAALVPLVLGGIIIAGESTGAYPHHFSMALLALGSGAVLVLFVWRAAAAVEKLDRARLATQAQLEDQREWLHITLASIGDGVIATDTGARVTFVNEVASKLTGWSQRQARGVPIDEVFTLEHKTHHAPEPNPIHQTLATGEVVVIRDHAVLRRRGGTPVPIEDSSAPIRNHDGEVVGAVLVFRDVTERVQAQRRRDEFLAMLAHELRNPLAPVLTCAEVLEQYDPPPPQERMLAMIKRQTEHMSRLVDDLLDVSRLTSGKVDLQMEELELADVVFDATEDVRALAEKRHHTLSVDIDDASAEVIVEADSVRLHQIITNLLLNSIKYTPDGGEIEVSLAPDCEDESAIVRVTDNGKGISADELPHIFETFAQAERPLDRAEGGLGLGLAVVRELVERHGGSVEAHSDGPDRGAEFLIKLPIRKRAVTATHA